MAKRRLLRIEPIDIYEDLKAKLISGALAPGMKLKPAELQGEYQCAPNTIRDVLMRLSIIGLVEFQMQRGFRATASSLDRRSDVARFRILLEQEGARDSMRRGGIWWEADLAATHHKLLHIEQQIIGVGDVGHLLPFWTEAEREFHETLISACGSPMLIETYAKVYLQFRQQFVGQQRDFGANYFEAIIQEHQAIVDAALARDEAGCRQAIYDHLKRNLQAADLPGTEKAS